jgi:cell wall-associated NlpC family hydrolase
MANGLGVTLAVTGSWLTYCGIKNVAPIQTLVAIVQTPQNARAIIRDRDFMIDELAGDAGIGAPGGNDGTIGNSDVGAGNKVVAFARSQIGKDYQFGGTGNPGWDCSGLVQAALKSVGVDVAHGVHAQLISTKGKFIHGRQGDYSNLLPGDIIFPDLVGDHVGIYAGNGKIIHAPKPGSKVSEIPVWGIARVKRFTAN